MADKSRPRRSPLAAGVPGWIAVVDDDPSVRKSLARLLRAEGMLVEAFATASEFVIANDFEPPACLVLDVHLGTTSGFELQEQLASTHPDLPIVLITAHDEISSAELTRRAGPDGYLRKPFDGDTLVGIVRRRCADE